MTPLYFGLMTNTISKTEPYLVPVASEVTLSVNLLAATTLLTVNPSLLSISLATGTDGVLNAVKIPNVTLGPPLPALWQFLSPLPCSSFALSRRGPVASHWCVARPPAQPAGRAPLWP
jgi:hypothetical protein